MQIAVIVGKPGSAYETFLLLSDSLENPFLLDPEG